MTTIAPEGLQFDLLTVVHRLSQIRDAGGFEVLSDIADRLITCDLPRLQGHLTWATIEWAESDSDP